MTPGAAMMPLIHSGRIMWIMTIPPSFRYRSNVSWVRRSPVSCHWRSPYEIRSRSCQPSSKIADWMAVEAAV